MDLDDYSDLLGDEVPAAIESGNEEENYEDLHMSLDTSYSITASSFVQKISLCRGEKSDFVEMLSDALPDEDVRNAYSEYEVAYSNTMAQAQLVIDKLNKIISKKMVDNDTLSSHMTTAVEMCSQFTATVNGKYNLLANFGGLGVDLIKFLSGREVTDVIEQNVIACISGVRYCVVNHEHDEHERMNADFQLLHSDSLFKCMSNVEEILYAKYLIDEIIQLRVEDCFYYCS